MTKTTKSAADSYFDGIHKQLLAGNATEHSYRPALKALVEQLGKHVLATNEPKRIKCGAPDFIVTSGEIPLGYIEAKDIGESLTKAEKGEQMGRYLPSLANLILTDYLEFRWYVSGKHRLTAKLASLTPSGKVRSIAGGSDAITDLLNAFLAERAPTIANPRELAKRMAAIARMICDTIRRAFDSEPESGALHDQMKGFREVLLHDLEPSMFADMYAQTIAYGLFTARANAPPKQVFTREHAAYNLPKTNPFLRRMFGHIAGPELDDRIAWAVDDLAELLHRADMAAILTDFGNRVRQEDPVVHFYETFLAEYDPKMRDLRGVYYTPEPVVSYIVRSVDKLLKSDFDLPAGLADASTIEVKAATGKGKAKSHRVLVLDPATGTGTFLHSVVDVIHEAVGQGNPGMWSSYVSKHLLPRLFGFELLMAPYAVAHMKLGLQLSETGYDFKTDERIRVYLTNTLEEAHAMGHLPLFTQWLSDEANAANVVKKGAPVMVILGNPPYSGHSANKGSWISALLKGTDSQTGQKTANYFEVDGQPLDEAQVKWLQDDYVKFVRFAQWRIEHTGYGVLGFITNNGYLDNPTFRGMRESLLDTFDDIYILDLHGSTKKREVAEDGTPDKNVFDIQQGVAIALFVRRGTSKKKATVRHAHLRGPRETVEVHQGGKAKTVTGKYDWLTAHDVETTTWKKLAPSSPAYLFVPQATLGLQEYQQGWLLTEAMPERSVGIVTARDALTIQFTADEVLSTVRKFAELEPEEVADRFGVKDGGEWSIEAAQADLNAQEISEERVVPLLYRPFDLRYTYYTGQSRGFMVRPQYRVIRHMLTGNNLGLSTSRGVETSRGWEHIFAVGNAIQHHSVSLKEVNYLLPLYLLPESDNASSEQQGLGDLRAQAEPTVNLALGFVKVLQQLSGLAYSDRKGRGDLTKRFGPEDALAYIYAVLNSESYRTQFAEFLKRDYPRVPLVSSATLFRDLVRAGRRLLDLHLLRAELKPSTKFRVKGSNVVEDVQFESSALNHSGTVWINDEQSFSNVSAEAWEYRVGGYRICEKWLQDRTGRELSYDDLSHYLYVTEACVRSRNLVREVDEQIEEHGGWLTLLKK